MEAWCQRRELGLHASPCTAVTAQGLRLTDVIQVDELERVARVHVPYVRVVPPAAGFSQPEITLPLGASGLTEQDNPPSRHCYHGQGSSLRSDGVERSSMCRNAGAIFSI